VNFRFLNIPVHIAPTFWIFFLLFTNLYRECSIEGLILGGVLIFSLLVHEYGHAFTALYFGAQPEIILEAFGGHARYNSFKMTLKQQFLITLNGPLLESLLIVLPFSLLKSGIFEDHYYIQYFLSATMRLNLLWCLLNLLPVLPLDGGHLLSYLLMTRFGSRGQKASLIIGMCCVLCVVPYLYLHDFFFFGTFLLLLGFQNYQMLKKAGLGDSNPFNSYARGIEAIKNDDLDHAKAILKKLLKSKDKQVKNSAAEGLAKIYYQQKQNQKSYELLLQADHQLLKEGKCLLCKLAFERKNYALIGTYARDIYAIEPSYEIALLNSKAFASMNQPLRAGAWLHTASQFDIATGDDFETLLSDKIYDSVRHQEAFQRYAEKIESKRDL
jgi:stage IV sporulation protein FB